MQKHNKKKNPHVHAPHIRIGAVAIAIATGFHISHAAHLNNKMSHELATMSNMRAFHAEKTEAAREMEAGRHSIRFDEGLRLPSTSGSNL